MCACSSTALALRGTLCFFARLAGFGGTKEDLVLGGGVVVGGGGEGGGGEVVTC